MSDFQVLADLTDIRLVLDAIRHTLRLRWWIFALIALIAGVSAAATLYSLGAVKRLEKITMEADARSIKNEAAIDAAMRQQVIYQQRLVEYMDYLSKKNPKITVPRVKVEPPHATPIPRPDEPSVKPLTDEELRRSPAPAQTASTKNESTSAPRKRTTKNQPAPTPAFRWPWSPKKEQR